MTKTQTQPKHPNRLAAVMAEKDWTVAALKQATGLGEGTVYDLKNQKTRFSQKSLKTIADVLGVPQGALLEDGDATPAPADAGAAGIQDIHHAHLRASTLNPRKHFDDDDLNDLAQAIAQEGVLENLVVRPHPKKNGAYEIVAGERRFRAVAKLIDDGRADHAFAMPCRIKDLTDIEVLRIATMENVQREDLHPLEEGEAYRAMVDAGDNTETIAAMIGKTQRHVQLRIELAEKLSEDAKDAFMDGTVNLAHARALVKAPEGQQGAYVKKIARDWYKNAQTLAEDILKTQVPIEYALFDTAKYDGAFTEDPDDPENIYFADKAQFDHLQADEVEARRTKYLQKYAFVEVCPAGDFFSSWKYEPCKDKAVAGVIIDIDGSGKVTFRTDLVKKQTEMFETPKDKAKAKKDKARPAGKPVITKALVNLAKNRKSQMVQDAVSQNFGVALRLAVLGLMGGDSVVALSVVNKGPRNNVLDDGVADRVDAYRAHFKPAVQPRNDDHGGAWGALRIKGDWGDKRQASEAAVFRKLLDMADADVQDLFAHLVAAQTGTFFHDADAEHGDDPVPVLVADAAGVDPAAHPAAKVDDEYLAKLDRPGLIELAKDAKIFDDIAAMNPDKGPDHMPLKILRGDILRDAPDGYVHPLLRFATTKDIKAAEKAQAEKDAKAKKRAQAKTKPKKKAAKTVKSERRSSKPEAPTTETTTQAAAE